MIDHSGTAALSAPVETPRPVNHVFVDFENVHSFDPTVLAAKPATITILIGPKQTRMNLALVEQLLPFAGSVELVRLESSGKNALDFALAYYLGRKAVVDPTAVFHIVSGDKGFDPLVEHLLRRHIKTYRHDGLETLTFIGTPKVCGAPPEASNILAENLLSRALSQLKRNPKNRPKRLKTLMNYLKNLCGKNATESDVQSLFMDLQKKGGVNVDGAGVVTYLV